MAKTTKAKLEWKRGTIRHVLEYTPPAVEDEIQQTIELGRIVKTAYVSGPRPNPYESIAHFATGSTKVARSTTLRQAKRMVEVATLGTLLELADVVPLLRTRVER